MRPRILLSCCRIGSNSILKMGGSGAMRKRYKVPPVVTRPGSPNVVFPGTYARTSIRFISERLSCNTPSTAKPETRPLVCSCDPCVPGQDTLYASLRHLAHIQICSVRVRNTPCTISVPVLPNVSGTQSISQMAFSMGRMLVQ
jgi:hypothetical protein